MSTPRYAYLHGFGSNPNATKAVALAEHLRPSGIELVRPSFEPVAPTSASDEVASTLRAKAKTRPLQRTFSEMLDVLDEMDAAHPGGPWRLVGSSMGGWLAARWAELHPEKVDRLMLLCPAFGLVERWALKLGPQILAAWESAGSIEVPDANGQRVRMGWNFVSDARRHPLVPEPRQPTVIVHGTADTMVPIESSEAWIAAHPGNAMFVVDDDHGLAATIPTIHALVDAFLREPGEITPEAAIERINRDMA